MHLFVYSQVGGRKDPAVDDEGWLDAKAYTPFGLLETTGKYAFQVPTMYPHNHINMYIHTCIYGHAYTHTHLI